MKISILGSGPITNRLAEALCVDSHVEIITSQGISIDGVEISTYKSFISQKIHSDVVIIAWRGLPNAESEKMEVLKHLSQNVSSDALIMNLSSVAVYGQNRGINFETTKAQPINPYGYSKLDLESYLESFAKSRVCNLRISNVFGDSKFTDVLNLILDSGLNGNPINLVTPSAVSRDFIAIDTLIEILKNLLSVTSVLARREVINVSSGESTTLDELLKKVQNLTGLYIPYAELPLTQGIIERSLVSNVKMISLLRFDMRAQSLEIDKFIRYQVSIDG